MRDRVDTSGRGDGHERQGRLAAPAHTRRTRARAKGPMFVHDERPEPVATAEALDGGREACFRFVSASMRRTARPGKAASVASFGCAYADDPPPQLDISCFRFVAARSTQILTYRAGV